MDKKTVSPGLVFLLVLLVVAGIFLLYSKLTFTGFVTNVANATTGEVLSSNSFDGGDFSNTVVNSGSVVLMPTKTTGTFVSQVFDAGQNVLWNDFSSVSVSHSSSNYTEDSLNNSVMFYVRACNDTACTGKDFVPYSNNPNLVGQYFQYKATMQILSGSESPRFSEINVSYYPPLALPINIESPLNQIYNNETVLIKISTTPGATIWFYNGTDNELYTAEVNKTFVEGSHVLDVVVSYIDGRINYTNSASVAFTVGFLKTFYRYSSNACSAVTLTQAQKTANDYTTNTECQTHITNTTTTTTTTTTDTQSQTCAPKWECFFNDTAAWSECVDGIQTRYCADTSTCLTVSTAGIPPETQACTGGTVTTQETTTTPAPTTITTTTTATNKGFFSFVGSAIVGPIFKSTIGVITAILLVLIAGGFLAYKFLLTDKLKLKFFNKFKGKKKFFNF